MERMQSTWENLVQYDMSESGVRPVTLRELVAMGFDLDAALDTPLGYSQSNGTIPLREHLAAIYPGATVDHIEVTNGTSEANYLVALSVLEPGDEMAMEIPNYMQLWGVPRSLQAPVRTFRLRPERQWEPDWDEFERAVNPRTRLLYLSNPNNPSGAVLSDEAMRRIVAALRGDRTPGSWPTRCTSAPRLEGERTPQLLGDERQGDRDQRPVEGLRDSRRAHRLDRRAAVPGRHVLEPARLPHHRAQQAVGHGGARRGRRPRTARRSTSAPAPSSPPTSRSSRAGRRASATCWSSTGRAPAR